MDGNEAVSKPFEAATKMENSLENENISNILKKHNEIENLSEDMVASSSRDNIDTEEMDIVTDLDSIKDPKMNEEDGVILKPLEATTEINSDHQNPKDENCTVSRQGETGMEKYVKHILKVNKESNNPLKQLNIIPAMNIKENIDLNEENGDIYKLEIFPEKNIEQNPKSKDKNNSLYNNISIIKYNEQSQEHDNPSTFLHVLHCQGTKKEVNISSIPLHVLHCPVTKKNKIKFLRSQLRRCRIYKK